MDPLDDSMDASLAVFGLNKSSYDAYITPLMPGSVL
jgi:hypothetical protein